MYIVAIIIIMVVYILYKKGIIQKVNFPRIEFAYLFDHRLDKVNMSYKLFNGINKYPFAVGKNKEITLRYHLSVQRGSLTVKFVDGNTILFDQTFTSDKQGEFVFTPASNTQFITVTGNYTKGNCDFVFIKKDKDMDSSS